MELKRALRLLNRYGLARERLTFKGTCHLDLWDSIEREYAAARKSILKAMSPDA